MKARVLIYCILFVTTLSSCLNKQYIGKNNKVLLIKNYTTTVNAIDSIYIVKPTKGFLGELEVKDDYVIIKTNTSSAIDVLGKKELSGLSGTWQSPLIYYTHTQPLPKDVKYYFKAEEGEFPSIKNKNDTISTKNKFKYWSFGITLQSLAIPFKIRPGLENDELGKIPPQGEAGFTVALAGGYKINHNVYRAKKNIFDKNVTTFSLTPGIFIGSGTADLSDKTTFGPIISTPRKAVTISKGGFLMFGADKFNIGYGLGFDQATGPSRNQWIYKGKAWHAIVIGVDIIK